MSRRLRLHSLALALALFAAGPAVLEAQQSATVTGIVRSSAQQPVRAALVAIPSLNLTTIANESGMYRIEVPDARGQQVSMQVSSIGYRTEEVNITLTPGTVREDVQLQEQAIALDALVVTGTAGSQRVRAQSAQIAQVSAEEISEVAPVSSVSEILQSRVPSVSVTSASGTSGGGQVIRIRGTGSISLSNDPLVFIDGIRADDRQESPGVGGQAVSRLSDLNPDDIERIEVVKGPAASTLYGADASAGVIQIFTKRGAVGSRFTQSITTEYNLIDQNWTPPSNFATCSAGLVANANSLCAGRAVGDVIEDNPLVRDNAFRDGQLVSLAWSGRGGGENYGYYLSFNNDQESGTLPNNSFQRRTGRFNFDFVPHEQVRIEAGYGFTRTNTALPDNDNNIYGFLGGGLLGDPRSVGTDVRNGFFGSNRDVEAISAITNEVKSLRSTPTVSIRHDPTDWFTHRIRIGADMTRSEVLRFFPKNENVWYGGLLNTGSVDETRRNFDRFTLDYLGNISSSFGADANITSDLSFGAQVIDSRLDRVGAEGTGLVTNAARVVSAASANISGNQGFSETRQIGILGQWELGFQDKLFLQLGARVDQNSSFGEEAPAFFVPKVGVSYVISDEAFWQESLGFINTMRVRTVYGTTGRSPTAGASLETFNPAPYAITATSAGAGVIPLNPGNTELDAERGTEFEFGFDAGLLEDRISLEFTYFNQVTKDLLLRRPLPPSLGFDENPFVNIGEVKNSGIELLARARVITRPNVAWELEASGSTLNNELVSLGDIEPFGVVNRFVEGRPLGSFHTLTFKNLDVANDRAIVSDTLEFVGNVAPGHEGRLASTLTLFQNLRIYGQIDGKWNYYVNNLTDFFRETQLPRSDRFHKQDQLDPEDRLRRFGPFFREDGSRTTVSQARGAYIQPGDFLRFRELSATLSLPTELAERFGASRVSLTVAGRNLGFISKKYEGADPEVIGNLTSDDFNRRDFLTIPNPRRFVARVNFQF